MAQSSSAETFQSERLQAEPKPGRRIEAIALGATLAVHAVVFTAIASLQNDVPVEEPKPLMVSFVPPAPAPVSAPEPPKPVPPPPQPVIKQKPKPVIASQKVAAEPPPMQVPPPESVAAPETSPTTSVPVSNVPAAPPAPAVIEPPRFDMAYLDNPAPAYPSMSRSLGEQGTVRLKVLVSTEGKPLDVQIERSSGYERLDQAALRAVRKWRFVPAKQGDRAVEAYAIVPIEFSKKKKSS